MKLVIISHTEHYKLNSGEVAGWGPTIREINFLAHYFDCIYHCAPLIKEEAPPSALKYENKNIVFIPLKPSGGNSLSEKLNILFQSPYNIGVVANTLKKADVYQFRAPTGIGVYLIPWLLSCVRKTGWFKYAGNWAQINPPKAYAFQRWLLKSQSKHKVTINGRWPNQPSHCLTFENPCLTDEEVVMGESCFVNKDYSGQLNFCFVGRLESEKGVERILKAFSELKSQHRIGTVHFVGDGNERQEFEEMAKKIPYTMKFHGFLSRAKVAMILEQCHVFLLPTTASEGFPKVIAEAANYGCLPVVSNVSSIGQYVKNDVNGYVLDYKTITHYKLARVLEELMVDTSIKSKVEKARLIAKDFTFSAYLNKIRTEVLN